MNKFTLFFVAVVLIPSAWAQTKKNSVASANAQAAGENPAGNIQDPWLAEHEQTYNEIQRGNFRAANVLIEDVLARAPRDNVVRRLIASDKAQLALKIKFAKQNLQDSQRHLKLLEEQLTEQQANLEQKIKERKELDKNAADDQEDMKARIEELKNTKKEALEKLKQIEAEAKTSPADEAESKKITKQLAEVDGKIIAQQSKPVKVDSADEVRSEIRGLQAQKRALEAHKREIEDKSRNLDQQRHMARMKLESAERELRSLQGPGALPSKYQGRLIDGEIQTLRSTIEYQKEQITRMKQSIEETTAKLP